jgi:hypothetical protein
MTPYLTVLFQWLVGFGAAVAIVLVFTLVVGFFVMPEMKPARDAVAFAFVVCGLLVGLTLGVWELGAYLTRPS